MKVKYKFNSKLPWCLSRNRDIAAVTLYPYIFFKQSAKDISYRLWRHEHIHIEQVKTQGWLKFYFNYLKDLITSTPYHSIDVEYEAYDQEHIGIDEVDEYPHLSVAEYMRVVEEEKNK